MSGLFSSPKMPAVPPPAVMPSVNDEAVKEAKRKAIASAQQRGGRASTILTGGDTPLGEKLG